MIRMSRSCRSPRMRRERRGRGGPVKTSESESGRRSRWSGVIVVASIKTEIRERGSRARVHTGQVAGRESRLCRRVVADLGVLRAIHARRPRGITRARARVRRRGGRRNCLEKKTHSMKPIAPLRRPVSPAFPRCMPTELLYSSRVKRLFRRALSSPELRESLRDASSSYDTANFAGKREIVSTRIENMQDTRTYN